SVTENPAPHLECVGDAQAQLQTTIGQLMQFLARVPEAVADIASDRTGEEHSYGDGLAFDDAPGVFEVFLGVEAGAHLEADCEHLQFANPLDREDALRLPPVAVAHQVEPAVVD